MGTTTLVLQYKPGPGRRSVPLARISNHKLTAQAARLAVADAERRARESVSGDRLLAYRAALEAAKLAEILNLLAATA